MVLNQPNVFMMFHIIHNDQLIVFDNTSSLYRLKSSHKNMHYNGLFIYIVVIWEFGDHQITDNWMIGWGFLKKEKDFLYHFTFGLPYFS